MHQFHRSVSLPFLAATLLAAVFFVVSVTSATAQPAPIEQNVTEAAFAERLTGTWRADLNAVVAGRIAHAERPGLAAIFGAVANDLLGENYGIVEATAQGTGTARGVWMQDEFTGTGNYTLHDIDGDRATIHVTAPESGVNHRFRIQVISDDRIDANYDGQTVTFLRI